MCTGRRVLLVDRGQILGWEAIRYPDQRGPQSPVDECHLPVHEPHPDDVRRFGQLVEGIEDGTTRWYGKCSALGTRLLPIL